MDKFCGRGELHCLSWIEPCVVKVSFASRPEVGQRNRWCEMRFTFERANRYPEEYQGSVIQSLSDMGEVLDVISSGNGQTHLVFLVPCAD